jgi:hypothetical protein
MIKQKRQLSLIYTHCMIVLHQDTNCGGGLPLGQPCGECVNCICRQHRE